MRTLLKFHFAIIALAAMLVSKPASAQETNYKSYTLFVYNFMKYIEWPESTTGGDFILGVLGDSPIYKELDALAKSKKVKGRNIVVKKISTVDEARNCHLVYVPPGKSSMLKMLNEQVKDKPVLVVCEREGLAQKGAALSFVTLDDDVLKFDINKTAIEQHSLKIPSSLISLGMVVK